MESKRAVKEKREIVELMSHNSAIEQNMSYILGNKYEKGISVVVVLCTVTTKSIRIANVGCLINNWRHSPFEIYGAVKSNPV